MKAVHHHLEVALGQLQFGHEFASIFDLVDFGRDRARNRVHRLGFVVDVVPTRLVQQTTDHVCLAELES